MSNVKGTPIIENGPTLIRTLCGHTIYGVLTEVEEETKQTYCYTCTRKNTPFKVLKRSRDYTGVRTQ